MTDRLSLAGRIQSDWRYIFGLRDVEKLTGKFGPDAIHLVPDELESSIDRFGSNTAFVFEGVETSYREMDDRANRFANWAAGQGVSAGDTVALFLDNRPDLVSMWFGLSKLGVTVALINSNLSGNGLIHCLRSAGARAVVTCEELAPVLAGTLSASQDDFTVHVLGEDQLAEEALEGVSAQRPSRENRAHLRGKDVALYIYTSGTTGLPKAARMSHSRCLIMMSALIRPTKVTPSDRVYETLPLYHGTTGLCGVGLALLSGAAIILRRKFSASAFWPDIVEHKATMFVYVGEVCRYLINQPPSELEQQHNVRCILGNGLRADVWQKLQARIGIQKIVEFYGSTEGNISLLNLDSRAGAVGRVPPLIRDRMPVRIVAVDRASGAAFREPNGLCREAATGEPGEAIGEIRLEDARWRFDGYNDKQATEKKILRDVFRHGDAWFRSGDLMKQDHDGYFYFVDRMGDTFRWKSENVSTSEVELVVNSAPGVEVGAVFGVEVPRNEGRAGMAAICVAPEFDPSAFYAHVDAELPTYARPVFLRLLKNQVLTGTMKIRKTEVQQASYQPTPGAADVLIADPTQKTYRPITPEDLNNLKEGHLPGPKRKAKTGSKP
ncbi:MAG: long-chain-acyl-CoA synthetase [Ponticaulis sp.]|nr:long-chain-acyl-CoA synthetase [Ponticaulis sp.]|tara:strand:+ start:9791 stop:11617 length:1827 start_codon:yes stop_codon:yes gene_type:complete